MNIFKGLTESQVGALHHTANCLNFLDGAAIFKEGDESKGMYVILEGKVEIFRTTPEGDIILNTLGPGDVFGEIGLLLPSKKRTASARAAIRTNLLQIPQNPADILEVVETNAAVTIMENLICLLAEWLRKKSEPKTEKKLDALLDLKDYNLDCTAALKVIEESLPKGPFRFFWGDRKLKEGDLLCMEGEESDGFYFIHSGDLEVLKTRPHASPEKINRISGPTIAGESGFFSGQVRSAHLRALSEVTYTLFSGKDYEKLKKKNPEHALHVLRAVARLLIHMIITTHR